jgi:hypothetical protein
MWKKIVKRGDYWFWVREIDGQKVFTATRNVDAPVEPLPDEGGYHNLDSLMKLKGVFYRRFRRIGYWLLEPGHKACTFPQRTWIGGITNERPWLRKRMDGNPGRGQEVPGTEASEMASEYWSM